jgi:anti-anti-sigma factor
MSEPMPKSDLLRYETREQPGAAMVLIGGELDMGGTFRLEQELTRLIDDPALRSLTLDLSGVTFMDSTGLGLVLNIEQEARTRGFALHLIPGRPEVQRVFELAGLGDVLPFDATPG